MMMTRIPKREDKKEMKRIIKKKIFSQNISEDIKRI